MFEKLVERFRFRNVLAFILQAEIMAFWTLQGLGLLKEVPEGVNGALIAVFTLITQFYFRKKGPEA